MCTKEGCTREVRDVQEIMASGKWELERIITHEFPLNELEQAIRTASDVDHANTSTLANEVNDYCVKCVRCWIICCNVGRQEDRIFKMSSL